jgi:hypothetical protein
MSPLSARHYEDERLCIDERIGHRLRLQFWPGGTLDVREKGVSKTEGAYVQGEVFRVGGGKGRRGPLPQL